MLRDVNRDSEIFVKGDAECCTRVDSPPCEGSLDSGERKASTNTDSVSILMKVTGFNSVLKPVFPTSSKTKKARRPPSRLEFFGK
jgi:hypothetical protein